MLNSANSVLLNTLRTEACTVHLLNHLVLCHTAWPFMHFFAGGSKASMCFSCRELGSILGLSREECKDPRKSETLESCSQSVQAILGQTKQSIESSFIHFTEEENHHGKSEQMLLNFPLLPPKKPNPKLVQMCQISYRAFARACMRLEQCQVQLKSRSSVFLNLAYASITNYYYWHLQWLKMISGWLWGGPLWQRRGEPWFVTK